MNIMCRNAFAALALVFTVACAPKVGHPLAYLDALERGDAAEGQHFVLQLTDGTRTEPGSLVDMSRDEIVLGPARHGQTNAWHVSTGGPNREETACDDGHDNDRDGKVDEATMFCGTGGDLGLDPDAVKNRVYDLAEVVAIEVHRRGAPEDVHAVILVSMGGLLVLGVLVASFAGLGLLLLLLALALG